MNPIDVVDQCGLNFFFLQNLRKSPISEIPEHIAEGFVLQPRGQFGASTLSTPIFCPLNSRQHVLPQMYLVIIISSFPPFRAISDKLSSSGIFAWLPKLPMFSLSQTVIITIPLAIFAFARLTKCDHQTPEATENRPAGAAGKLCSRFCANDNSHVFTRSSSGKYI